MNPSLILNVMAPVVVGLAVPASLFILVMGHNHPGGGFVGGLVAAAGIIFFALARGREAAAAILKLHPAEICGAGVLLAMASGLPGLFGAEAAFLAHQWWLPELGLGTALLFDIGVYLTVVGMATAIFLALLRS